ncbi:MAG TPA: ABC transporter substrate-binding protein [Acidimicrobiales bacterium]
MPRTYCFSRHWRRSGSISVTTAGRAALGALVVGVAVAAAPMVSGASPHRVTVVPAKVPAGTTLRVGDQLGVLESPLAAAGQNKAYPYAVSYSNFVGGPPMLQAFQAGAIDVGWVADTPLIYAQAAHQGVVAVAAYATRNASYQLVTAAGSSITSWKGLKGKKVAYQQGTSLEAVLLQGLHSAGLSLNDITSVNLPSTQLVAALEGGSVDAAVSSPILDQPYLDAHPSARAIPGPNNITDKVSFLIADQSTLSNPAKVAALGDYITRLVHSYAWVNSHSTQWAQQLYVAQYKLPLSTAQHLLAQSGPVSFLSLPGPLSGPQQNLANLYSAAGEIPAKVAVGGEFSSLFNQTVKTAHGGVHTS